MDKIIRTEEEVDKARAFLSNLILKSNGLSKEQRAILSGASVALQWMVGREGEDNALQQLLAGRRIMINPNNN